MGKDDFLDDVSLYWLINTVASTSRIYWEAAGQSVILSGAQKTQDISLPVAITVFPDEVYRAPESWARPALGRVQPRPRYAPLAIGRRVASQATTATATLSAEPINVRDRHDPARHRELLK